MKNSTIEKINKFTRREFSEDELYIFSVILCDNDVDRDFERFSDNALETIAEKFIGKTGVFDHNPSASNQNARIFDTEVITDETRMTKTNEPYKYVKAYAYMIRTDENKNLIAEIDGGIKKEVSISCSASSRLCSVCGSNLSENQCGHVKGQMYGNTLCYTILDDITDAYEWSFVAVPAQVNAGVTKYFSDAKKSASDLISANNELIRDIRRLAYFRGGKPAVEAVELSSRYMNTSQLISLKKSFESAMPENGIEVQLMSEKRSTAESGDNYEYRIR